MGRGPARSSRSSAKTPIKALAAGGVAIGVTDPPERRLAGDKLGICFDLIFTTFGQNGVMTKTLTADIQRKNAERQLFGARRALNHLVELYDSGQWRNLYKEDTFAEAVREARRAVELWTDVVAKSDSDTNAAAD
jgi:hypothetical protein